MIGGFPLPNEAFGATGDERGRVSFNEDNILSSHVSCRDSTAVLESPTYNDSLALREKESSYLKGSGCMSLGCGFGGLKMQWRLEKEKNKGKSFFFFS